MSRRGERNEQTTTASVSSPETAADHSQRMKTIYIMYLITALEITWMFLQFSVTPYLAKKLGFDTLWFGYLQTMVSVVQLLGGPVFGRFADLFGARMALSLVCTSTVVFFLLLASAETPAMLFIHKLPTVFMHILPASQMVVTDLSEPEKRADALSKLGLCFGIGMIAGSTLGGQLSKFYGERFAACFGAAGSAFSLLLVFKFIPKTTKAETTRGNTTGLPGVQAYLDDIICYGSTQKEHDENLQRVLQALAEAGLKLNMHKCRFSQPSLNYLGHTISKDGLQPDQDRVTAVIHAPAPHDMSSLRSCLGLTSWYSKFIPDFATVREPLRAVLRDSTDLHFKWTVEAESSFTALKELIVNSSALALYDPELPTYVITDASDYGLGAVLTQFHSDQSERVVAFASRTLSPAEHKYSTVEREALACVWAVERWRTYLWGRRFVLRADHQALTTLLTSKGSGRAGLRIARWSARLLCFTYDITYRPGHQNVTADCLSRLPLNAANEVTEEPDIIATVFKESLCAISLSEFSSASETCPELSLLRNQIQKVWPKCKQGLPENLTPYFQVRHELSVHGSLIMRGTQRLVVPVSLQARVVDLAHEGHQGIVRTKQGLRELFWWPHLDKLVHSVIASCVNCQFSDKVAVTAPAPLTPVTLPSKPWEKVAIDITGPFDNATWDCHYAIVLTDYYSKWPEVAFASTVTTDVIIRFLATVFSREGNPMYLVSDNGCQFTSHAFSNFLREREIQHLRSSVYYPKENGAVERFNRVLKDCIQISEKGHNSWKEAVTEFLHNYRATPHATTGASPFELLRNRKMRTKLNILPVALKSKTHAQIKKRVKQKQTKMKEYTDKKMRAKPSTVKVGDTVRVRRPEHVPKGSSRFTEPRTVMKKVGQNTYLLNDGRKWNASKLAHFPKQALTGSEQNNDTVLDTFALPENTNVLLHSEEVRDLEMHQDG